MKEIDFKQLIKSASEAAENAYAPYSNFKVGACILFDDGSTFCGCNVENASYGLTICAERNALSSAVAAGKKTGLAAVAIFSPNSKLCYPCGACRQWIYEFSHSALIAFEDENGEPIVKNITELLPHAFEL